MNSLNLQEPSPLLEEMQPFPGLNTNVPGLIMLFSRLLIC